MSAQVLIVGHGICFVIGFGTVGQCFGTHACFVSLYFSVDFVDLQLVRAAFRHISGFWLIFTRDGPR
jgi:hypothetical protein